MENRSTYEVFRTGWKIAHDPQNLGQENKWYVSGLPETAVPAVVPSLVHQYFPDGFGTAWYYREFIPSFNREKGMRYILRFGMAEFYCDIYLNGIHAGYHRGVEDPFEVDITDIIIFGKSNKLYIRCAKQWDEDMFGLKFEQIPHRNQRRRDLCPGACQNVYGLREEVTLLAVSQVRITDTYLNGNIETGCIDIRLSVFNAGDQAFECSITAEAGSKHTGDIESSKHCKFMAGMGENTVSISLKLNDVYLWSTDDPYLYFVNFTLRTEIKKKKLIHKLSRRCGFRRFEVNSEGYFCLNGKRIFLRCSHTGNNFPEGIQVCIDPELMRRDFILAKASGLNAVRFISGYSQTEQLDFCDEIGLMVYQEPSSGWLLEDSSQVKELYLENLLTLIKRDRSHPCIVIWGLLNETPHHPPVGAAFDIAVNSLPDIYLLDKTRLVLLGSGRFDGHLNIGSFSNPFSEKWNCIWNAENENSTEQINWKDGDPGAFFHKVGDLHGYPRMPHSQEHINLLRQAGSQSRALFISEYGVGSMFDVIWLCRKFEQRGTRADMPDYRWIRMMADNFLADWHKYKFDDIYAFPIDLMRESARLHSRQRAITFDIVRSNPKFNGYSITGLLDHAICGEGLWTLLREWKSGIADVMQDGLAPLKWCLFINPTHVYSGKAFTIEGVLADEDILATRSYYVMVRIKSKQGIVYEKNYILNNEVPHTGFSVQVFQETVLLNVPSGEYELHAEILEGAAATDGFMKFYVTNTDETEIIPSNIYVWGVSCEIKEFLNSRCIQTTEFEEYDGKKKQLILIGNSPESEKASGWTKIYNLINNGCSAFALNPSSFVPGDKYGASRGGYDWLYHKEYVSKPHKYFKNMPGGCILDWEYYIYLINGTVFCGGNEPDEVIAASFGTGLNSSATGYEGGFNIGRFNIGGGVLVVNTFDIAGNIGKNPAADMLLLNIITNENK